MAFEIAIPLGPGTVYWIALEDGEQQEGDAIYHIQNDEDVRRNASPLGWEDAKEET